MTNIEFKTAEIPATSRVGRKPLPNPFTEVFPSDDKAVEFTIPEAPDSTEAKRIVRQVRAAAKAVKRSGRTTLTPVEGGGTKVLVWTVEAIVRKDKAEVEAPKTTAKKTAAKKVTPNPKAPRAEVKSGK
jgi:hypothetical protein